MKHYNEQQIDEIACALNNYEVLAFPTDTVYGVGVKYGDHEALAHLKQVKHRPETKPIPMMCASLEDAAQIVQIDERAKKIAKSFLPGALTLILPLTPQADRTFTNGMETAALRIPDTPWLLEVMKKMKTPLLVSSANISGMPAALCAADAQAMLGNIDGIVEGECQALEASTILDCTGKELKVLRQGPISIDEIMTCF